MEGVGEEHERQKTSICGSILTGTYKFPFVEQSGCNQGVRKRCFGAFGIHPEYECALEFGCR